jgi:hypothetical protein
MAFELRSQSPLQKQPEKKKYSANSLRLPAAKPASNYIKELGDKYPIAKSVVQFVDPTGVTSHDDVKKAWNDGKTNSDDILEPLGAIPLIGKIPKVIKAIKGISNVTRAAKIGSDVNRFTSKVNKTGKFINAEKVAESPLQKQKLSPLAAKKKAARDLAYAKSDDRRIKKAHSQRMHRKNPGNKGKDYDHEDGRFESVKQNRGNEGEGTKKESGKNYKITK